MDLYPELLTFFKKSKKNPKEKVDFQIEMACTSLDLALDLLK
jgi:hypothetical protein